MLSFISCPVPLSLSPSPLKPVALFNPLLPESDLSSDGTEHTFGPPPPLLQRMWAGGSFTFSRDNPLKVGDKVRCDVGIEKVRRYLHFSVCSLASVSPAVYLDYLLLFFFFFAFNPCSLFCALLLCVSRCLSPVRLANSLPLLRSALLHSSFFLAP